ncbi:MAG: DUF3606 domain-containing protein [Bacteroidetes bacterium]|nr:DUF3606 domain-containing protein [Bacteroidota bacterium]
MSKVLEMKMPSDLSKVNTNNLSEFLWWNAHLGVGPEKLLAAIEKVGNSVDKIREYIQSLKIKNK